MFYRETLYLQRERSTWVRNLLMALGATYVLALSAQLRVSVPFSPVPVTGQTLVVLLMGALLGRRIGLPAVGTYLVAGGVGLPFFAGGSLVGPTGGYLLGFAASVFLVSTLMDRGWGRRVSTLTLALVLGTLVIYMFGLPWLALFVGPQRVLTLGLLPFVIGDLLKMLCATGIVAAWNRL